MDGKGYHLFLIVHAVLMLSSFTQAEEKAVLFEKNHLQGSSSKSYLERLAPISAMQCARACAGLPGCKSFSVLPSLQECSLYSSRITALDISPPASTSQQETFYSSRLAGPCPSDKGYAAVPQTSKCLRLYQNEQTWAQAESTCEGDGGHLAVIENLATWSAVRSFLKDEIGGRYVGDIYVGGLKTVLGQWVWLDGSLVKEEFWAPDEPNNVLDSETCLELMWWRKEDSYRLLNDIKCTLNITFLCEM